MKISKKAYYGVRAVLTLAQERGPLSIHALAKRENLPEDYLEKILQSLRKAGVVEAKKGTTGGYILARSAKEVSMWDILRELDGPLRTVAPVLERGKLPCFQVSHCQTNEVWRMLEEQMKKTFSGISVEQLITHKQ